MSESRAKRERKERPQEVKVAPKKSKGEVIVTVMAVILVVAVAALGGYAVKDDIKAWLPEKPEPQIETIGDYAESIETTVEELLAKCGMENLGLTEDSMMDDMYQMFTIDSYAKFTDTDAETLKAVYGIEELANDTSWQEAQMKTPMFKVAEQSGMSFEDFAAQNQLPAEITKDMTYEEAMEIIEAQFALETEETAEETVEE